MRNFRAIKKFVTLALVLGALLPFALALKTSVCTAESVVSSELVQTLEAPSDSLKDITKPYLGFYESEEVYFNGKDQTESFKNLTVELTSKNQFILRYQDKNGKTVVKKCKYSYNEETGVLKLKNVRGFWGMKHQITLKNGEMNVLVRIGKKNLKMKLTQK
ncbi:MAG: hypothetical protein IJ506_06360 [Clostridia bacterium]|nr:hypothetical protein [Clostridia bacterium]